MHVKVFTLQSIKSRIETLTEKGSVEKITLFLLYSPLNQGLKLTFPSPATIAGKMFLLYSPLNQGLKPLVVNCAKAYIWCFYSTVH